jgi:hypothetical protein
MPGRPFLLSGSGHEAKIYFIVCAARHIQLQGSHWTIGFFNPALQRRSIIVTGVAGTTGRSYREDYNRRACVPRFVVLSHSRFRKICSTKRPLIFGFILSLCRVRDLCEFAVR